MLSKEEIGNVEHAIKNFNGKLVDCLAIGKMLTEYYNLETDKQKLIEKLEETIKYKEELIDLEYEGYKEYYARTGSYPNQMKLNVYKLTGEKNKAQEILEILKGEKE